MKKCYLRVNEQRDILHSDITVIILHGQILILYNWRPYLSITPRILPQIFLFFGGGAYAVAHMVEALRNKPEGRGFDSRWCHWNFSLT